MQRISSQLSQESSGRKRIDYDWKPNPGPQTEAYCSNADILGYGGAAGGGKSDLILGLAATAHRRSVIFRRVFPNLRALIERSREIFAPGGNDHSRDSYNESLHPWALPGGQMVEFEACQHEKDREKQRGRPRDMYAFDEATEFNKSQVMFIIAWLRSTERGQRCRVVLTFNPPTDDSGGWIVEFFRPWLAYLHPEVFTHDNPAAPGELRWYATIDGQETEFMSGDEIEHNGEKIKPLSRTFIPAKLADNPFLNDTNYRSVLQSMPEPFRSQLLNGDFGVQGGGDVWQVIPIAALDRSMERWKARSGPSTAPLTRVGIDVARGGRDETVKASVHADGYCGELEVIPGRLTPDGESVAALVYACHEPADVTVAVDVIGVGSSPVDILKKRGFRVVPIAGSARATVEESGKEVAFIDEASGLKCVNLRSACYWNLRLLLEQDLIDLPPSPRLRTELLAHRWTPTAGGIKVLSKDQVKEAIDRSPNESDAVVYAYWIPVPIESLQIWDSDGWL
jgi:hypothetical protein